MIRNVNKQILEIHDNPVVFQGTQGYRGTPVENHWIRSIVLSETLELNESCLQIHKINDIRDPLNKC